MFVWREDTSPSPLVRRSLRENGPHERAATPRLVAKRLRLTDGLTTAKRTRKKKGAEKSGKHSRSRPTERAASIHEGATTPQQTGRRVPGSGVLRSEKGVVGVTFGRKPPTRPGPDGRTDRPTDTRRTRLL